MRGKRRGSQFQQLITFDLPWQSGLANLGNSLTINGTTKFPAFKYDARNATATTWTATYGEDLSITGAGDAPSVDQDTPLLGSGDVGVKLGMNQKYFERNNVHPNIIGTDDFVVEVVFRPQSVDVSSNVQLIFGETGAWNIRQQISAGLQVYLYNGALYAGPTTWPIANPNFWVHLMIFFDRSGYMQMYANGEAATAAFDITSRQGSAECSGISYGNASPYGCTTNLAYIARWSAPNWLDTHLQASVAQERFWALTGVKARKAKGSKLPTTCSRTTAAYLDKTSGGVRTAHYVGPNWPRIVSRVSDSAESLQGYLPEPQISNICADADMTGAEWTDWTATTTASSVSTDPLGNTAYSLSEDDGSTDRFECYDAVSFSDATKYSASIFLKSQNSVQWAGVWNQGMATGSTFDILNGAVGTTAASTDAYIEDWGNGWYRCIIVWTQSPAQTTNIHINAHTATGDILTTTHAGRSQIVMLMSAPQWEAKGYATSYIPTSGASATRTKDVLIFNPADGNIPPNSKGSVELTCLIEDINNLDALNWFEIGNNQASNRLLFNHGTGDEYVSIYMNASGGDAGGVASAVDLFNNAIHTIKVAWGNNIMTLNVDDEATQTDSASTFPTTLSEILIGALSYTGDTHQPAGVIGALKIKKR